VCAPAHPLTRLCPPTYCRRQQMRIVIGVKFTAIVIADFANVAKGTAH
jgi:hypothetical protein